MSLLFADTGGERRETYQSLNMFSAWLVERDTPEIIPSQEKRYKTARFNEARSKASEKLKMAGDFELAEHVSKFQFKDIRLKAASDIDDIGHASKLLGHSKEKITKDVYRRVGEIVSPTR